MLKLLDKPIPYLVLIGIFILLGLSANMITITAYAVISSAYFFLTGIKNKNANGEFHLLAANIVGVEVFLRMLKAPLPHEVAKYTIIFVLGFANIFGYQKTPKSNFPLWYVLLLLPSIFLTSTETADYTRDLIAANISGPVAIGVASYYFFNRPFSNKDIFRILRVMTLPLISLVIYLQFKTINLETIEFAAWKSTSATTGGYGPNQVSTALGIGMLVFLGSIIMNKRLSGNLIVDVIFLGLFSYRGLLTFSRGGVLVPVLAVVIATVVYFMRTGLTSRNIKLIFTVLIGIGISYVVWGLANTLTGDALERRYQGETGSTVHTGEREFTSGRAEVMELDMKIFLDHPILGVGPGMGTIYRANYGYDAGRVAAHVEFTRLFCEHGILGFLALITLAYSIWHKFKKIQMTILNKFFALSFLWFALLTTNHNALRLSAPAFFIGLSLVADKDFILQRKREILKRQAIHPSLKTA